jgi:hypothetical protein
MLTPPNTTRRVDMKKITLFTVLSLLLITLLNFPPLFAASRSIKVVSQLDGDKMKRQFSTGTNYAVIIGINQYRYHPILKTAVNDAEEIANLLQRKYFFTQKTSCSSRIPMPPGNASCRCSATLWPPR